jgi:pimeloyl-ACP methyl ester carboxylesterase
MATYVLLHGAYQGGWIWQPVATRLRAAGHTVYAPTLDGCGERAHLLRPGITVGTQAQEIAQLLFYEDLQDVVLVGTSSGGMVLCKAAELARERVARLVFVDALALLPGEQVESIVPRTPNSGCLPTSRQCSGPGRWRATLCIPVRPWKRRWSWTRFGSSPGLPG